MPDIDVGKRYVSVTLDGCLDAPTGSGVKEKVFAAIQSQLPQYYSEDIYPTKIDVFKHSPVSVRSEEHPRLEGYSRQEGFAFYDQEKDDREGQLWLTVDIRETHQLVISGTLSLRCPSLLATDNPLWNANVTGRVANLLVFGPEAARRNYSLNGQDLYTSDDENSQSVIMTVQDPTVHNMLYAMTKARTLVEFMNAERRSLEQVAQKIEPLLELSGQVDNAYQRAFRHHRRIAKLMKPFSIEIQPPPYDARISALIDEQLQHEVDAHDLHPPKGLSHYVPLLLWNPSQR